MSFLTAPAAAALSGALLGPSALLGGSVATHFVNHCTNARIQNTWKKTRPLFALASGALVSTLLLQKATGGSFIKAVKALAQNPSLRKHFLLGYCLNSSLDYVITFSVLLPSIYQSQEQSLSQKLKTLFITLPLESIRRPFSV